MTAGYQGLVTKWEEMYEAFTSPYYNVTKKPDAIKGLRQCIDELAEVIALDAQPSPDEGAGWQVVVELEQLKARWWAGISGDGELSTTLTELADKLRKFLLARPVQPSPEYCEACGNMPFGKCLGCEHSSQFAYTEDGGKNIVCLLCEREARPVQQPAPALEPNWENVGYEIKHKIAAHKANHGGDQPSNLDMGAIAERAIRVSSCVQQPATEPEGKS